MKEELNKNCVHYWKIAPQNGATSDGECIYCHARKVFYNSMKFDGKTLIKPIPKIDYNDMAFLTSAYRIKED